MSFRCVVQCAGGAQRPLKTDPYAWDGAGGGGAAGVGRFFADLGDAMASGGDPLPGHWKLLDAQSGWGLLKIEGSEAKGLVPPVLLGIGGPRPWKWGSLKTVGGA